MRQRPFGIKEMNPNLKTDYEKDKKKFELKMQKLEK